MPWRPLFPGPSLAWLLVLLAWGLGLGFFWAFPALPFQDLIAHGAFLAARARYATSPFEQSLLIHAPRPGPYSLFHVLGALLGAVLGPLPAMRALACLVWTASPFATVWIGHRLFGRRSALDAFVGLLVTLGFLTMLGLVAFQLAAALLLVVDAEWLLLLREPRPHARRLARFAVLPALLFLAHGMAFALFLGLAGVAWLVSQRPRRAAFALLPSTLVAAALTVLAARPIAGAALGSAPLSIRMQSALDKLSLLLTPTLLTRFGVDAAIAVLAWVVAGALVWRTLRSASEQPGRLLAWQACAGFVAFVVLPHGIGPLGFVDARLLPTVLALALSCRAADSPRLLRLTGTSTFVLLGCGLIASARFQHEALGFERIASQIPAQTRLLHLPLDPDSRSFVAHPFLHYDKLALIDRPLIVSDSWFHPATALYPRTGHPSLRLPPNVPFSVLGDAPWAEYRWHDWDLVLIRTQLDAPEPAQIPASLQRIDHVGGFWLYRVQKPY